MSLQDIEATLLPSFCYTAGGKWLSISGRLSLIAFGLNFHNTLLASARMTSTISIEIPLDIQILTYCYIVVLFDAIPCMFMFQTK